MTANASSMRRFVAGSGIAIVLLAPVSATSGTCDERAERRAEMFARRADHSIRYCIRRTASRGGGCPDERTSARLARWRASLVRVFGKRCPTTTLEARLDGLIERILCHRLGRCASRFGSARLAVVARGSDVARASEATRRLAVDSGWTGIAHDLQILEGAGFVSELTACGAGGDGRCELFGRTAGAPFGAPSPISAGGIPVCVTVDFATDVIGHVDLERGDLTESATVAIGVYDSGTPAMPCPACVTAGDPVLGATGICRGGANDGNACVVGGLAGPEYGALRATSVDCPPAGGPLVTFRSVATATTGDVERPAGLPCGDAGGGSCWCAGQYRPNGCADGVCTPTADGGVCALGPVDMRCEHASYAACGYDGDCPAGDRCGVAVNRSCFPDPIRLHGTPAPPDDGVAHPTLVGVFCMASSRMAAVDNAAGYPGPTAFTWPAEVTFDE